MFAVGKSVIFKEEMQHERTSSSGGISTLLNSAARHFAGISLFTSSTYYTYNDRRGLTSSTVVIPHSRFMQNAFSCQKGQSRYKSA